MKTKKLIFCNLEISSFAGSVGAEHYYGKIVFYENHEFQRVELKHILTAKEARYLTKKDEAWGAKFRKGMTTERFESKEEIVRQAKKLWKKAFPKAHVLLYGSSGVASIQPWLDCRPGLEKLMAHVNVLYRIREKRGGYEQDPEAADAIDRKYWKLTGQEWK